MGLTRTLLVAGTGAALAYFMDPVSGKERRAKLRQYWQERVQGEPGADPADETSPPVVVPERPSSRTQAR
jgi:hypothetical protein